MKTNKIKRTIVVKPETWDKLTKLSNEIGLTRSEIIELSIDSVKTIKLKPRITFK